MKLGALPPTPRSLSLWGNQEGQGKGKAEPTSPVPPSSPHLGARVALQQSPILRVGTVIITNQSIGLVKNLCRPEVSTLNMLNSCLDDGVHLTSRDKRDGRWVMHGRSLALVRPSHGLMVLEMVRETHPTHDTHGVRNGFGVGGRIVRPAACSPGGEGGASILHRGVSSAARLSPLHLEVAARRCGIRQTMCDHE